MIFAKFDRYVDRHARNFTERLQSLCRMPSVAARGTGMRAIAETVEQSMQRVGMGTRSFRIGTGYPIIYGECGGGPKTFVVYGHYDVRRVGRLPPPSRTTSCTRAARLTAREIWLRVWQPSRRIRKRLENFRLRFAF